jgi:hypothetical protein
MTSLTDQNSADYWNGIIRQHADAQIRATNSVTQDSHRGWSIHRCEWTNGWYAIGPNYDASYEGPEDGWVDNGEKADAATRAALIEEIDAKLEERGQ